MNKEFNEIKQILSSQIAIHNKIANAPMPDFYNTHDFTSGRLKGQRDMASSTENILKEVYQRLTSLEQSNTL